MTGVMKVLCLTDPSSEVNKGQFLEELDRPLGKRVMAEVDVRSPALLSNTYTDVLQRDQSPSYDGHS